MTTIIQLNQEELRAEIKSCLRAAIDEIKSIPEPEPLPDRVWIHEAVEITGLSISQLYKDSMNGTVPHQKYGKRLLFSRKALLQWMEERTSRKVSVDDLASKQLQKAAKKRLR